MTWGNGTLDTRGLPSIATYVEALRVWEESIPIRGRKNDRKFVRKANRTDMYVTKNEENHISFWLWGNRMVTWLSPTEVDIKCGHYARGSGAVFVFAGRFLPAGVFIQSDVIGARICCHTKNYRTPERRIVICQDRDGAWTPKTPVPPWAYLTLDATAARAALRATKYHAFLDWVKATEALGARWVVAYPKDEPRLGYDTFNTRQELRLALDDPARWSEIMESPDIWYQYAIPDRIKAMRVLSEGLRDAIYRDANVIKLENKPWLWDEELGKYHRLHRKYRHHV